MPSVGRRPESGLLREPTSDQGAVGVVVGQVVVYLLSAVISSRVLDGEVGGRRQRQLTRSTCATGGQPRRAAGSADHTDGTGRTAGIRAQHADHSSPNGAVTSGRQCADGPLLSADQHYRLGVGRSPGSGSARWWYPARQQEGGRRACLPLDSPRSGVGQHSTHFPPPAPV